jgi:hypothetical protein
MKTTASRFLRSSAAVTAAAILAFWFTFGSQVARSDETETASLPGPEMTLVPVKSIDALEQRIKYLEESIAALTESWQHINTHRLCVSDDSGAETCITKAQLDSFLGKDAHVEVSQPATSEQAGASPSAPIESVAATEPLAPSEPATVVGEKLPEETETTGTVSPPPSDAAIVPMPEIKIYEEAADRSDD